MLYINDVAFHLEHTTHTIEKINALSWLASQNTYPKVYWAKDGVVLAATGKLLSFSQVPKVISKDPLVRLYGGIKFPSKKKNYLWSHFPSCDFWLPEKQLYQNESKCYLTVYASKKADVFDIQSIPYASAKIQSIRHNPSFRLWQQQVNEALSFIDDQIIDKIVLARKTHVVFEHPPCVWPMMRHLISRAANSTCFVFQLSSDTAFFGASPETLFFRKADHVTIDALAGTCPRGKTQEEDKLLEKYLHLNSKEQREFQYVKKFIQEQSHLHACNFKWLYEDHIRKTSQVQHLYNQAHFYIHNVTDNQLLQTFHPTPAVGGYPREKALEIQSQLERFNRGMYASPVGWVSESETHFTLGIRSALMKGRSLHLFAGAGIVSGSQAEKEWEELEHKTQVLLHGCGLKK